MYFFYNLWSVKKIIDLILNKHSFHTYQPDLLTQSEGFFFPWKSYIFAIPTNM